MKKLIRIGLIVFGVGLLSGFGTYLYVFHKPHRNIVKEKPSFILDAQSLYSDFSTDETASYEKYGDKVIEITGEVVDYNLLENGATMVYLDPMEGISCSFDSLTVTEHSTEMSHIQIGNEVTVKGKCDGFDMIMGVVLTRCVVLEVKETLVRR